MADLHILRSHALGLPAARLLALAWAAQVEQEFGMACTYVQGESMDEMSFTRPGLDGTLRVNKDQFELDAQLGFLLSAFKASIEREITKNMDQLLNTSPPGSDQDQTGA